MKQKYHHLSIQEVFKVLKTQSQGLSNKETILRLKKFGYNKLPETKKFLILTLFLRQFKNPLVYILFSALIISFIIMHFVDAWIILAVILASSVVGFLQEYKANQALSKLKQMIKYKAKVLRDNKKIVIDQEDVVPGDIIFLFLGDKVPADARLIKAQNFEVMEAALTGESFPSSKHIGILPQEISLADRENMIYLGTVVASGNAKAVVVATGQQTEFGRIATLVKETEEIETSLQKQLNYFGKVIGLILISINILIFSLGLLTGKPLFEMFLISVATVVSAVPEGLLPAMTVILTIGMQRLAKHKGLVRKMLAAETLGSVSVICVDKTGTLTQGEMRVSKIITQAMQQDNDAKHALILKIGLLCNNSVIENFNKNFKNSIIVGDPTEKALFLAGHIAGLEKENIEKEEPRIAEIPFDSEHKFMATLHKSNKGEIIYAKGAPERILERSSFINIKGKTIALDVAKRKEIQNQYENLTSLGLRVLAMSYKLQNKIIISEEFIKENLNNLVFVGLIGFKDPIRPEAKSAIELCQDAGIRPMIVTGDHKLTAMAVVQELGIQVNQENVLEGVDLDRLSDKKLQELVKKIIIFARVEPKHKIRIVSALQANNEVVAMTGDGANDAPALKKADIGIAVGFGTDVAKEVADLVLLDNNFKTIVEAVKRGRITFNNIRKVMLFLLTDASTSMTLVGGSILLGLPLPLLPSQILWIKLAESSLPAMAMAFDEIDEGVMNEKPRSKNEPLLNAPMKWLIIFYAIVMDLILFGLFYYFWKTSGNLDFARTIAFAGLGIATFFYVFAVRGYKIPIYKINPFNNKFLLLALVLGLTLIQIAIYMPFFNNILHTVPLGIKEWFVLGSYAILSVVVYEVGKKFIINNAKYK